MDYREHLPLENRTAWNKFCLLHHSQHQLLKNCKKKLLQDYQVSIAFLFHFRLFTLVISKHELFLDTCRKSLLFH